MLDDGQSQLAGDFYGVVTAAVIDHHDLIDGPGRNVFDGPLQRALGVVSGHDGDGAAGVHNPPVMNVVGRRDGLHQAISLGITAQKRLDSRQAAATTQVL